MTDLQAHQTTDPRPLVPGPSTNGAFQVQLDVFEGPLDLLLKLIERKQLDISKVALAEVSEGFLLYLEAHPDMPPGPLASFVWVASKLLWIKSQALLPQAPVPAAEEDEDPGDELVRRLEAYKRVQETANWLRNREAEGLRSYERPAAFGISESELGAPPLGTGLEGVSLTRLVGMVQKRMQLALPTPPAASMVMRGHKVTIADKVTELRKRLNGLNEGERLLLSRGFVEAAGRSRTELVVLFMAVLEIIRRKYGIAEQDEIFGEIWLRRTVDEENVKRET